ncbi:MAG: ketoacyl-ACP synthase III [Pseudomonadales bacterium]
MEQNGSTKIVSMGHYLPPQRVKSSDLMDEIGSETRFGVRSQFLSSLIGVDERRYAPAGTLPSALAIEASLDALQRSNVGPAEIDYVIYCGIERDWQEPATAHRVQSEIGAYNAACFDVTNACHGFMNGLAIADAFIGTGSAETCLVCTGEVGSKVAKDILRQLRDKPCTKDHFKLQIGALTLGDAGAAMIVQRSNNDGGFKKFRFSSAGEHAELCYYNKSADGNVDGAMYMKEISSELVTWHKEVISQTYDQLGWQPRDVKSLFLHQFGARPHKWFCELADIDVSRAPATLPKLGNIASATIPVTMSLNPPDIGDNVLVLSSGSGLSIGQTGLTF